jgi:2-polyprenyl-3-methyl-5-hydroxy-6-metoxy-1,4-benzoquinol methylase
MKYETNRNWEGEEIMYNKIFEYLKKPELYAASTSKFWDDEHISKGMLEAHLNPSLDAASRNHDFIHRSIDWIEKAAMAGKQGKILDLGCGPGLYAQGFAEKGYDVTGIDFSKRSIEYAKQKAVEKGLSIEYIYGNYLDMDYQEEFDLITLIYCDFGVLTHSQREILLKKITQALKKGGRLILDVFTPENYEGKEETATWYLNEGSGFWKPETHLCLESHYIYEDNIRLDQYVIVAEGEKPEVFRIWDHYYTSEMIKNEIKRGGFEEIEVYSDVAGKPYDKESATLCIVAEKQ